MKILELRFKNLNSLHGEWRIDFTAPAYAAHGIFAITGPTGAGKSTILDALCLALYGSTPRLGKITKTNEIMSRQTSECYAEVTFESQAGTFRCHWEQHRARKKADGSLVDSTHEIADALTGQILESKKRDVAGVIEEKTGMNFERFTRSILLAQGGFAVFLQANADERAPILEQITGTEIYSDISKRLHERTTDENTKLNLLKAEIGAIPRLEEAQIKSLNEELLEKQTIEKASSKEFQKISQAVQWLNSIAEVRGVLAKLTSEKEKIASDIAAFQADHKKLTLAEKAAELEGAFEAFQSLKEQQFRDKNLLKGQEEKLPVARLAKETEEHVLQSAEEATLKAKTEQKNGLQRIQQVRILDVKIEELQRSLTTAEKDCKETESKIREEEKRKDTSSVDLQTIEKNLALAFAYINAHPADQPLVTQLGAIEAEMRQFHALMAKVHQKKEALLPQQETLKTHSKNLESATADLKKVEQQRDALKTDVLAKKEELQKRLEGRALPEYRKEKDALLREEAYIRKISSLQEERKKLQDGIPCPLCGGCDHPFANGNLPESSAIEKKIAVLEQKIEQAENIENVLKKLENDEKVAEATLNKLQHKQTTAAHDRERAEEQLLNLKQEWKQEEEDLEKLKTSLCSTLQPFGIPIVGALPELKARLKKWQEQQEKQETLLKSKEKTTAALEKHTALITLHLQDLDLKRTAMSSIKVNEKNLAMQRFVLFGTKKTEEEEKALEAQLLKAEDREKIARKKRDDAKGKLETILQSIQLLNEAITLREPELKLKEASFTAGLKKAGFFDSEAFNICRLTIDERNKLRRQEETLRDQQTQITALIKERETHLAAELERKLTQGALEEITQQQKNLEDGLKKLQEEIPVLQQRLRDDQAARENIQQKQALIDRQLALWRKWKKLHELIGSADGKKYRNFAQGITFDLMISHANRQLEKMSDRYILVRDEKQPLELNVIDTYQANEIRSTKNLSGGESFIVSLSLALGLSKMASRKVRVDSLFLDEGFGTLDEEALDTALDTLSGLHHDGKLIGIISHVPALKERISTQINVYRISGGKSGLSGPGAQKVVASKSLEISEANAV